MSQQEQPTLKTVDVAGIEREARDKLAAATIEKSPQSTSGTKKEGVETIAGKASEQSSKTASDMTTNDGLSGPDVPLNCRVDFAIYPLGTTTPFSDYIDKVEQILKECGLQYKVHAEGTTIEGEMMEVMRAIKCCHQAAHAMQCPRIVSNIRLDTGKGAHKTQSQSSGTSDSASNMATTSTIILA
ncbi:hypothetical protein EDD11_008202 [Mortierella claussenii]|nr:hypothetical protein EDD11_008202 [Mortierella claussenii]